MRTEEIISVQDEERMRRSDFEVSEDEPIKRTRIRSLKKKAVNASTKLAHGLKKRGKRISDCRFASIAVIDVRNEEEEEAVNAFRQVLVERDLIPIHLDDYHTMLRFLKARRFDLDKTVHMWEEMLKWRKENGVDTISEFETWTEIDAIVLQWIYGTISDDILARVLETESTAHEAWERVRNHFLNNKGSRAAALENEFNTLTLDSFPSLDDYCQRVKDLGEQLTDVGSKVDDQRLVLQLVRGLPRSYDVVGAYINQTLPSFETARSMLQLEQQRTSVRHESPPTVLVANSNATNDDTHLSHNSGNPPSRGGYRPSNNNTNRRSNFNRDKRNNGSQYSGNHSAPNQNNRHNYHAPSYYPPYPYWAPPPPSWTPPPCPYPTQPGWTPPWPAYPRDFTTRPRAPTGQPRPSNRSTSGHAHIATDDVPEPSTIGSAFNAMSLYPPDESQWYMDTGASSHLTSDPGPHEWHIDFEEQQ